MIAICFGGFKNGRSVRVKHFTDVNRTLAYVNKLFDGKWLSDEEYHTAYSAVDNLRDVIFHVNEEYFVDWNSCGRGTLFDNHIEVPHLTTVQYNGERKAFGD